MRYKAEIIESENSDDILMARRYHNEKATNPHTKKKTLYLQFI